MGDNVITKQTLGIVLMVLGVIGGFSLLYLLSSQDGNADVKYNSIRLWFIFPFTFLLVGYLLSKNPVIESD